MPRKYKNVVSEVDGKRFDSRKESKRYLQLLALEKTGEIEQLECQIKFELIPRQTIDGKFAEHPANYIADFVYYEDGEKVVEDVKSNATRKLPCYVLKRKLMLKNYGIKIREI